MHATPYWQTLVDVDPEIPNPLQFDHAFAFLAIARKEIWLDSTLGVGPFGYLAPQLRGKEAWSSTGRPLRPSVRLPRIFLSLWNIEWASTEQLTSWGRWIPRSNSRLAVISRFRSGI